MQAKKLMDQCYENCLQNEDWLPVYRCIPKELLLKDAEKYGKLRDYRELATEETRQIIRGIDTMPILGAQLKCAFWAYGIFGLAKIQHNPKNNQYAK